MDEDYVLVVSRPVAACSRCKQAKTKCDGSLPACGACVKAGRGDQCSSRTDDEFARGRERSWVATLEVREQKMQRQLNDARRKRGLPPVQNFARASFGSQATPPSSPPPLSNGGCGASPSPQDRRRETTDIDELVSNFGVLSVNAAARDFHGFTNTMSYARLILAASTREPVPSSMACLLPARNEAASIANHYLGGMFRFVPIFEESLFWTALEAIYHPSGTMASAMENWVVRMVLAISLISRSQKMGDNYYWSSVSHVAAALQHADPILRPGSLSSIQAILLLVEYARYDPRHFDDWTLIGAVCRAMVDLGLHQDPPKGSGMSKARLRERRTVYHCIYVLDRSISIALDLAFSFSDAATNVQYPRSDSHSSNRYMSSPEMQMWSQPNEALYYIFKFRAIQSEIYSETCQSGRKPWDRPYDKIWPWWHKLNDCYTTYVSTVPSHSNLLPFMECLTGQIFLLAPCPRVPVICELAQSLIFEYCLQYVDNISKAMSDSTARPWLRAIDATRARKVSKIFVDLLNIYGERILQGTLPNIDESLTPNSLTPPRFPFEPRRDNAERAISFLNQMNQVLDKFGSRFGLPDWRDTFERQSRVLLEDLTQRHQHYNSAGSTPNVYNM